MSRSHWAIISSVKINKVLKVLSIVCSVKKIDWTSSLNFLHSSFVYGWSVCLLMVGEVKQGEWALLCMCFYYFYGKVTFSVKI